MGGKKDIDLVSGALSAERPRCIHLLMETEERKLVQLPARVRGTYANKFRNVQVITNHFQCCLKNIDRIVVFSVKIEPRIQSNDQERRKDIYKRIKPQVQRKIKKPVFRGFCIYSSEECRQAFSVRIPDYEVTISQRAIHQVRSRPKVFSMFLNNSIRSLLSNLGYTQIGNSGKYFTKADSKPIDNMDMYKGYCSNFLECERGMFLRVDTARKIVRKDTVLEFINSYYSKNGGRDKEQLRNQVKQQLINGIVMTNYGKFAFYRIKDVRFDVKVTSVMMSESLNLKDYYKTKYNIDIQKDGQPLLEADHKLRRRQVAGSYDGPIYLVPELCKMTGIPDNVDERRRKGISEQTILKPSDKHRQIEDFMKKLQKSGELQLLDQMGIEVKKRLNKMTAKMIPTPPLELGQGKFVDKGKESMFNLFANPIFSGKHGINMVMIFNQRLASDQIQAFTSTVANTSKNLKVSVKIDKHPCVLSDLRSGTDAIKHALKTYPDTNLIMFVLSNQWTKFYPQIKQFTLQQSNYMVLTQCVREQNFMKKNQSISTKVLLQMIAKRGNVLWTPSYQKDIDDRLKGMMLLGIESASKGGLNVMAACASISSSFSLHCSSAVECKDASHKFNCMVKVSSDCLNAYVKRNKKTPTHIVAFVSGSPGDQVNMIQENYCQKFKAWVEQQHSCKVNLTVIMVNLRNSERFFTAGTEMRNVDPGTLISQTVVSKEYDFFIVSQRSTKGSVVPNHFRVIFNAIEHNNGIEEGHIQELVFSQCFNYSNWNGSIKIPAVLQYAKKCAKFNSEYMNRLEVDKSFSALPYYL